ncbi:MAG: hypothetical protein EA342_08995 [Leptolyngbya sp. LCM1.Bin17]|nr:MAG: hypothetical protein EA342_08995 [Leptolyngbya sp. LCM1.Bin17]
MNEMPSNPMPNPEDDLQSKYRFDDQKAKPNRFAAENNIDKLKVVVLDDDVAQVFTTPESVNKALRALIEVMPQPQAQ